MARMAVKCPCVIKKISGDIRIENKAEWKIAEATLNSFLTEPQFCLVMYSISCSRGSSNLQEE